MADPTTDEVDIEEVMVGMETVFRSMPTISGDACLERVAANKQRERPRRRSLGASSRGSATDLLLDEKGRKKRKRRRGSKAKVDGDGVEQEVEGHVFTGSVITEIQQMVDAVDSDEDDLIDREQFADLLSEWGLDAKFTDNEMDELFEQLVEDEEEDAVSGGKASCRLFMRRLQSVHSDHPKYSARKAVYRVCRRLLRQTDAL